MVDQRHRLQSFNEPVPPGVLSASASLRPPPDPIPVQELMDAAIPEAWQDGKTSALALAYRTLEQERSNTALVHGEVGD